MKKVLKAIGGFFVKIGRWIANTAWVQPLLIVGGIFGIIFSIPYIKKGIENIKNNQEDDNDKFMKKYEVNLEGAEEGNSQLDKLLTYLEEDNTTALKSEFGEKFFVEFVKEDCAYCRECAPGFENLKDNFKSWELNGDFKYYTVWVDTQIDDEDSKYDGEYLAKFAFEKHQDLFDDIVGEYADYEDYALLNNLKDQKSTIINSINKLQNAIDDNGEGLETPTTFMVDLTSTAENAEVNVHGITAIFFNYASYISGNTSLDKGEFLRDCWKYDNLFDKDYFLNK